MLTVTCAEMGLFADGIRFSERGQKIAESFPSDQYLCFKSLEGLSWINFMKGHTKRVFEGARLLADHGKRTSNRECISKAINIFNECEATTYLTQAEAA